jgi:anti-sigma regulatory factor (Ser/Thr protein kinase)
MSDPAAFRFGNQLAFLHQVWPAEPWHVAEIRTVVGSWLADLGLPQETRQDLVLAASEAASNAVQHAYRWAGAAVRATVELTLSTEDQTLCIEVVDRGRWRPPDNQHTGRGIQLMRQLVQSITIRGTSTGTTVLLRHPLPGV